jgi:hypothetical protein
VGNKEKNNNPSRASPFTHEELLYLKSEANLSGRQMDKVVAGVRLKMGRAAVDQGFHEKQIEHNNQYEEYFSAELMEFEGKEGEKVTKPLVYCNALGEFIDHVEENRGGRRGKKRKLGGDSGKGFLKLTLTLYDDESIIEDRPAKKARRSREEGICGTYAEETGQRMILLLAVLPTVAESPYNLKKLIDLIGINEFPHKITGDLKFLMPIFGLKGCSSCNPCLYCNGPRTKGEWRLDDAQLRTFGNLVAQLQKLPVDGRGQSVF